eukprot:3822840-Pyramimonas_sp.AAC.1
MPHAIFVSGPRGGPLVRGQVRRAARETSGRPCIAYILIKTPSTRSSSIFDARVVVALCLVTQHN